MNYLFYGKDNGRVQKAIERVIKQYENSDVITVDMNTSSMSEVMLELTTLPFFSEHKVIILKNCAFLSSKNEEDLSSLEEFLNHPIMENTLIMSAEIEKCDARKKIVKLIQKTCKVQAFSSLNDQDKRSYVMEKCASMKLQMGTNTVSILVSLLPNDTAIIDQQLEKLACYPEKITQEVLDKLVHREPEDNIFLLSESLLKGNFKKAFSIYQDMKALSYDPIYFTSVLGSQFRFTYQVKCLRLRGYSEERIAQMLHAHPYRVKMSAQLVAHIDLDRITYMIEKIAACDQNIKSGKVEKYVAFELFLIQCQEGFS